MMTAPFKDYTDMSHRAKQMGGPKIYEGFLLIGGALAGVAAYEFVPRAAAWATPKIESMCDGVKRFFSKPVPAPKNLFRQGSDIKIAASQSGADDQAKGGVENEIQDSDALS